MVNIVNINNLQQAPKSKVQLRTSQDLKTHLKQRIKYGAESLPVLVKLALNSQLANIYAVESLENNMLKIIPLLQVIESDIKITSHAELS